MNKRGNPTENAAGRPKLSPGVNNPVAETQIEKAQGQQKRGSSSKMTKVDPKRK